MIDDSKPIFLQIAELIENEIVDGTSAEEAQVPSTNEFAAFHRINPATAAKGVNLLVDEGILYKRRGIGMFVATGARNTLVVRRREEFFQQYVQPLRLEARKLGIDNDQLAEMITRASEPMTDHERAVNR
ncbi:transcriptional regulator, GntR family [Renibacterium salmoninarum ATCC 33209]|uniref:Transcriptional regulator, GntR family n=1 Tax=Renibacterium salmoninarum (strain ATCC 33209 / DSM 20767 / JCM 11484 / NBRC 15589 / NCIMB 2235) TaxID=288705 RepID=A9WNQ3_RENSM|nr:GntR family transcriptional regulator [Renibacterium salmoninarum]ABY23216.1 transcriptional regulator, GntR family [Renibacterium salmoninarum ATCC 33209]